MSYEIKATPPTLDASASTIEQNAATVAKELQAIQEMLTTLRRTFVGQRASSFFKQYDTSSQEMQELNEILRSFAAEMRATAQRLRAADQG
jgi:WXG100 family type VII secretion target